MELSRRTLVKWATTTGIVLSVSRLGNANPVAFSLRETLPGKGAVSAKGRIDGAAKVTGAKLYASDYRAADMPGWPNETSHAILVRAPDATHVYLGLDLDRLKGPLKPTRVVTAEDVAKIGLRVPAFYEGDLFCPVGKTPIYLGQPVALLIFETFDAFDRARLAMRDGTFVRFGEETGPVSMPPFAAFRFTRIAAQPRRHPTSIRPYRLAG